ncbi:hypothetical protein [Streptomyces tendae]|uniref:hypothetical protein n=1 Tax=Streptomyces tendae TaxID=1932 RepID=UPI002490D431|nr:hypothetical protein [Streptomyces tendae]
MKVQGSRRRLVSASLVTLSTAGVTVGAAAVAHADTMVGSYSTQARCLAVKVVHQSGDPGSSYYRDNDLEAGCVGTPFSAPTSVVDSSRSATTAVNVVRGGRGC